MFESLSGNYTQYNPDFIRDTSLDLATDFYKNWIITIDTTEYIITGNSEDKIYFSNSISQTGSYQIDFVTRDLLTKYESDLGNVNKVSDNLLNRKITTTQIDFTQMIKGRFKNLYELFPTEDDPLSLIYNLYEVQVPFIYYLLSEIFRDTIIEDGDMNCIKEQNFKSKFKTIFKDAITLLAVDTNENNEIDNIEKSASIRSGKLLAR